MTTLLKVSMLAALLLTLGGTGSLLRAQDNHEEGGPSEPEPEVLGTVAANKGAISLITLTETAVSSTSSTSFVDLASQTVTVPTGQTGRILATFSGETFCTAPFWCTLRILVDNVEMFPQVGTDFAFTSPGDLSWESKAIDRVSDELGAGLHIVKLQYARVGASGQFSLDDWQLTLALWRVS
jgi:hypothetical protein